MEDNRYGYLVGIGFLAVVGILIVVLVVFVPSSPDPRSRFSSVGCDFDNAAPEPPGGFCPDRSP